MKRALKVVLVLAAAVVVAVAGALVWLTTHDFSGYRGRVEAAVSDLLGRELSIGGEFSLDLDLTPTVVAEDITLANADWSEGPPMARVEHLSLTVDLLSLVRKPVELVDVTIVGAEILLEVDPEHGANWELDLPEREKRQRDPDEEDWFVVEHADLDRVRVVFEQPWLDRPLVIDVEELDVDPGVAGMLDLRVEGALNDAELAGGGRLGPLQSLIDGEDIRQEIDLRIEKFELSFRGRIADLEMFTGARVDVRAHGPDMERIASTLGFPSLGPGPFRFELDMAAEPDRVDIDVEAELGGVTANARGRIGPEFDTETIELDVEASCPDLAAVGRLFLMPNLPEGPADIEGTVLRTDGHWTVDDVVGRAGGAVVRLDGRLGTPPRMVATDVNVDAEGPDLSRFSELAKVDLPAEPYAVRGRLVRKVDGVELEGLVARIGGTDVEIEGLLGEPPGLLGTDVRLRVEGSNLAEIRGLFGFPDPPVDPFGVRGRLLITEAGFELRGAEAEAGDFRVSADGVVSGADDLTGTDLRFHVRGDDLSRLAATVRLPPLPGDPFDARGRVRVLPEAYEVEGIEAEVGGLRIGLDGRFGRNADLVGTHLDVSGSGPDLSTLSIIEGIPDFPAHGFDVEGAFAVEEEAFVIGGASGEIGDVHIESFDARFTKQAGLVGSELEVRGSGPDLSAVESYFEIPPLPPHPFSVSGRYEVGDGLHRLDTVSGELAGNRFSVDGVLGISPGLEGTDVRIELSGPDIERAAHVAREAGLGDVIPDLPDGKPFSGSGRVRVRPGGLELEDVDLRPASGTIRLDGFIGTLPELEGTDLRVEARGPDASVPAGILGYDLPADPFLARGRFVHTESRTRFDGVRVELGGYYARLDGVVGELPKLVGTDLEFHIGGPGRGLITRFFDLPPLPDAPFEASGHFAGAPEVFRVERLVASYGASDWSGELSADLEGKPDVRGEISSRRVDVNALLEETETPDVASEEPVKRKRDRFLIPREPLELEWLEAADIDLRWAVAEFEGPLGKGTDAELHLDIRDGSGEVRFGATGPHEAGLRLLAKVEPVGDGHRVGLEMDMSGWRHSFLGGKVPEELLPPIDLDLELEGNGSSLHELLRTANGQIVATLDEGRFDNTATRLLTMDVVAELFDALNPFSKQEEFTLMECSVVGLFVEDGVGKLSPLGVRTDKMTIVGRGKVDFETEAIDLVWTAKPRRGIGLSASSITNPYVKLGGTLSKPSIEIKPLEAVASTSAAVFTMGLSILAKGFWDRITAEANTCQRGLEKIDKKMSKKVPDWNEDP